VYLNDDMIIDDDGRHSQREKCETKGLTKGKVCGPLHVAFPETPFMLFYTCIAFRLRGVGCGLRAWG